MNLVRAQHPPEMEHARVLFREYADALGVDLAFQGFAAEVAGLPGAYAPPDGALFLAMAKQTPAGCVAVRKLAPGVCEMKRLYVRPAHRGLGLGRCLAEAALAEGIRLGYSLMRLDTLDRLVEAMKLYESLGFRRCAPYYPNPLPGVVYWERRL